VPLQPAQEREPSRRRPWHQGPEDADCRWNLFSMYCRSVGQVIFANWLATTSAMSGKSPIHSSRTLPPGSPFVGSDFRAWHRFWADHRQIGSKRTYLVMSAHQTRCSRHSDVRLRRQSGASPHDVRFQTVGISRDTVRTVKRSWLVCDQNARVLET